MSERKECMSCKNPLMIARTGFVSSEGTAVVKSVQTTACLNPNCEKYGVVVERIETVMESFED